MVFGDMTSGIAPAIHATGLRKVYGGIVALADGDIDIYPGEIHALLGENGAGKSTMVRLLSGVERPDHGRIILFEEDVTERNSTARAQSLGLAVIHQQFALVNGLSIAENIALVAGYGGGRVINWQKTKASARQALQVLGVDLDPTETVGSLPPALQSVVAIARALALSARVLILDEPTAALSQRDSKALFRVLNHLRDSGVAIVLISHRLDEVIAHADRITVLRDGRVVHNSPADGMTLSSLVEHVLGRNLKGTVGIAIGDVPGRASWDNRPAGPRLSIRRLSGSGIRDVDLDIHPGEILACTGLVGAGHVELGHILFGRTPYGGGEITLNGDPYRPSSPAGAIARGVGLVTGDRNTDGVIDGLTVRENLFPNPSGAFCNVLRRQVEERRAATLMNEYDIRPRAPDSAITTLSGGNAQKVLLARVLSSRPQLLLLEDPTIGVDIGSRSQIHGDLEQVCRAGGSVLLISSDLEEVSAISDRVAIFTRGRLSTVLQRSNCSVNHIMEAMNAAVVDE